MEVIALSSLVEQTYILDMNLSYLLVMILPKLPSSDFQNAIFSVKVFHTVLLLTMETLLNIRITSLMILITLKQLI